MFATSSDLNNYILLEGVPAAFHLSKTADVQRLSNGILGLVFSNPPLLKLDKLLDGHPLFKEDSETTKYFQRVIMSKGYEIFPILAAVGFFAYQIVDEKMTETFVSENVTQKRLDIMNFEDGDVYMKVDPVSHEKTLHWVWKDDAYQTVSKKVNGSLLHVDESIHFIVHKFPTIFGSLNSNLKMFVDRYAKIMALENCCVTIEKLNAKHPYYVQLKFPSLRAEDFETLQHYSFIKNTNLDELDDDRKRFYNLYNIRQHIEVFEPEWNERTEEMIMEKFQVKAFHTLRMEKGVPYSGELMEIKYLDVNKYGPLRQELQDSYKDDISEQMGFVSRSKLGAKHLKDDARKANSFLKSTVNMFQQLLEEKLTPLMNDYFEQYFELIAHERALRGLDFLYDAKKKKGSKKGGDQPQREVSQDEYDEIFRSVKYFMVELKPVPIMAPEDLQMLIDYGLPLEQVIKVTLGSDYMFLIEGIEKNTIYTAKMDGKPQNKSFTI